MYYFSNFFFKIKHTEETFSCEKYAISLYQNMRFSGWFRIFFFQTCLGFFFFHLTRPDHAYFVFTRVHVKVLCFVVFNIFFLWNILPNLNGKNMYNISRLIYNTKNNKSVLFKIKKNIWNLSSEMEWLYSISNTSFKGDRKGHDLFTGLNCATNSCRLLINN